MSEFLKRLNINKNTKKLKDIINFSGEDTIGLRQRNFQIIQNNNNIIENKDENKIINNTDEKDKNNIIDDENQKKINKENNNNANPEIVKKIKKIKTIISYLEMIPGMIDDGKLINQCKNIFWFFNLYIFKK